MITKCSRCKNKYIPWINKIMFIYNKDFWFCKKPEVVDFEGKTYRFCFCKVINPDGVNCPNYELKRSWIEKLQLMLISFNIRFTINLVLAGISFNWDAESFDFNIYLLNNKYVFGFEIYNDYPTYGSIVLNYGEWAMEDNPRFRKTIELYCDKDYYGDVDSLLKL